MNAIFTTFGVDWRLLLINAFNFSILLFGLWYFLYKPMGAMLSARRDKVAKGVAAADAAQAELRSIQQSRQETLLKAGKEADLVLSRAQSAGREKERELLAQGEAAAAAQVKEAAAQAAELKAQAIAESKEEVAKLIVLGVEKVLKAQK